MDNCSKRKGKMAKKIGIEEKRSVWNKNSLEKDEEILPLVEIMSEEFIGQLQTVSNFCIKNLNNLIEFNYFLF